MNTFGLTSARSLNVRLLRADGSVHSVAPYKRSLRVHEGALVILRKSRLLPVVAITGDTCDVVLGSGTVVDEAQVDALAPLWRTEPAKPATPKADKPAKAPKAPKASAPDGEAAALRAEVAALTNTVTQLLAAFTVAQKPKARTKRA